MPGFIVQLPGSYMARTLKERADGVVVWAPDATAAKAMAKAMIKDEPNVPWDSATVTQLAAATTWASPDLWSFRIQLLAPAGGAVVRDVLVHSDATNDTVDELGAAFVTALTGSGLTPTYTAVTQLLQVAAIADNKGDHTLKVFAYPKGFDEVDITAAFFGAIVHQGIVGAVVTVTLVADAAEVPKMIGRVSVR